MKQAVAAAPGYFAQWKCRGETRREPILAWLIEPGAINPRPKPIGISGWCDDAAEIIGPDGNVVGVDGFVVAGATRG